MASIPANCSTSSSDSSVRTSTGTISHAERGRMNRRRDSDLRPRLVPDRRRFGAGAHAARGGLSRREVRGARMGGRRRRLLGVPRRNRHAPILRRTQGPARALSIPHCASRPMKETTKNLPNSASLCFRQGYSSRRTSSGLLNGLSRGTKRLRAPLFRGHLST